MIVSYSHNFIFIKTKKTAGTTVEAVLAPQCKPGDIVTLERSYRKEVYEAVTAGMDMTARPDKKTRSGGVKSRALGLTSELRERALEKGKFLSHATAEQVFPRLDASFVKSAYKFTIERHPYEKALSMAYFKFNQHADKPESAFPKMLDRIVRTGDYTGFFRWSIDGRQAVDEIMRQETLQADLDRLGKRLGLEIPEELPRKKGKIRGDRRPAAEILSAEQRDIIYERCKTEFDLLGYQR